MDKKTLRSADLAVSGLFLLLSLFICKWSLGLMAANTDRRLYISAGFLPLLFALIFAGINIRIILLALREGGSLAMFRPSSVWKAVSSGTGQQVLFILGWIAVYLFGMLRRLPYPLSTFFFLTIFMSAFYKRSIAAVILISLAVSVLITLFFGHFAKIPLP